jgi:hypothetical protein
MSNSHHGRAYTVAGPNPATAAPWAAWSASCVPAITESRSAFQVDPSNERSCGISGIPRSSARDG